MLRNVSLKFSTAVGTLTLAGAPRQMRGGESNRSARIAECRYRFALPNIFIDALKARAPSDGVDSKFSHALLRQWGLRDAEK